MTTVSDGLFQFGGMPAVTNILGLQTGTWFFVDPVNGADGNSGRAPDRALATLYRAHALMTSGNNDVCVLIGNGAAGGSARLSKALAQGIDSSATTGVLTWSKNACHLIGTGAPTMVAQRARIAPPTGTYTQATFGSGNFVVVSGAGCIFANFSLFHGFSTGGTNQICWTDNGQRNYYWRVHFGGAGDAASAQNAGSRSLKVGSGGNGENTFEECVIGLDTVTRTVANANLELAGATPRNVFRRCLFPVIASAATPLGVIGSGAGCIDRWNLFEDCSFISGVQSTGTAPTAFVTLPASAGGLLLMKSCTMVGNASTNWGSDATTMNQMYVDGGAPAAATSSIAVNPS